MQDNFSGSDTIIMLVGLCIGLISVLFGIVIWWKIFSKAGYSGALGLLMFVPIANLVVLLVLAFGEWPIQREVRELRAWAAQVQAAQGYPPQGYAPQQPTPPAYGQQNYPPPR